MFWRMSNANFRAPILSPQSSSRQRHPERAIGCFFTGTIFLMAKSRTSSRRKSSPTPVVKPRSLPPAKPVAADPQVDFLILSLMSAVVPMIESRCGTLNKRDQSTLKRQMEKAVREFVKGAK